MEENLVNATDNATENPNSDEVTAVLKILSNNNVVAKSKVRGLDASDIKELRNLHLR